MSHRFMVAASLAFMLIPLPGDACTIFTLVKKGTVLVGNNVNAGTEYLGEHKFVTGITKRLWSLLFTEPKNGEPFFTQPHCKAREITVTGN